MTNLNHDQINSQNQKIKNVKKHIRIANATTGHDRLVHILKAEKLIKRYGFPPLEKKS